MSLLLFLFQSAALSCGPQPPEEENEGGDVASEPVNTQEGNELVEAVGNGDNLAGQPQKVNLHSCFISLNIWLMASHND